MATARILVADDHPAILDSISWLLRENGYEVVLANGGEEAMTQLDAKTPDMMLLDILMPDADGCQLLERIKGEERWRDLPVLMMSSLPPEEASVRSFGLGAADFIRKTVSSQRIVGACAGATARERSVACHPTGVGAHRRSIDKSAGRIG